MLKSSGDRGHFYFILDLCGKASCFSALSILGIGFFGWCPLSS